MNVAQCQPNIISPACLLLTSPRGGWVVDHIYLTSPPFAANDFHQKAVMHGQVSSPVPPSPLMDHEKDMARHLLSWALSPQPSIMLVTAMVKRIPKTDLRQRREERRAPPGRTFKKEKRRFGGLLGAAIHLLGKRTDVEGKNPWEGILE